MKKLIILVSVFISSNVVSQIQYDGTNLKDVALQQATSTRKLDSIRITKNILTNAKLIDSLNQLIVDEINKIRKQHNLPAVQRIKSKEVACQKYAKQMCEDNVIGHYSGHPDAMWEICYTGVSTELMLKNLKSEAIRQVNAWMSSMGHREIILSKNLDNSNFSTIAIGQYLKLINAVTPTPMIASVTAVRFF
jgi:uncharacterized protein YkwD